MIASYGGSLFFFNDTSTTEIYTLSLHDALPISRQQVAVCAVQLQPVETGLCREHRAAHEVVAHAVHVFARDRKSTRLNSSHANISYAVFCLKKKKKKKIDASDSMSINKKIHAAR